MCDNHSPTKHNSLIHNHLYIIIVFSTLLITLSCSKSKYLIQDPILIAHAGGEIDGHTYTNSLEAVLLSIKNGYKFIELDLALTADSVLVAVHDWKEFNEITGFPLKKDTVPSYADFTKRMIYEKYTPLSAEMINGIFLNDTTLYLVTDKISNPQIIGQNFPHLKQRIVVEAFSYDDYTTLRDEKYFRVLYSRLASDFYVNIKKHLLFHYVNQGYKIEWIAAPPETFDHGIFRLAAMITDFKLATYTINNLIDIPKKLFDEVQMVYTDRIKPYQ